jgi:hypothetical protein
MHAATRRGKLQWFLFVLALSTAPNGTTAWWYKRLAAILFKREGFSFGAQENSS